MLLRVFVYCSKKRKREAVFWSRVFASDGFVKNPLKASDGLEVVLGDGNEVHPRRTGMCVCERMMYMDVIFFVSAETCFLNFKHNHKITNDILRRWNEEASTLLLLKGFQNLR